VVDQQKGAGKNARNGIKISTLLSVLSMLVGIVVGSNDLLLDPTLWFRPDGLISLLRMVVTYTLVLILGHLLAKEVLLRKGRSDIVREMTSCLAFWLSLSAVALMLIGCCYGLVRGLQPR